MHECTKEELEEVRRQLAEVCNDPNLTLVTPNHFTNELVEKLMKEINDKDGKSNDIKT